MARILEFAAADFFSVGMKKVGSFLPFLKIYFGPSIK
jgi:hypothetical protein